MSVDSRKKGLRVKAHRDVRNAKRYLQHLQQGTWFDENQDKLSFALYCAMASIDALEKVVQEVIEKEVVAKRVVDDYVRSL